MRIRRMTLLVGVAALAALGAFAGTAAAATTVTQLSKITPASGPELSSIPFTIHGTNFNTAAGGTTVTFSGVGSIEGDEATSVSCSSSKLCTGMTPFLLTGPAAVTVTSNGETSTNPVTYTVEPYSPPTVDITTKGTAPVFARAKLRDRYPAILTRGNIYLDIDNTTAETVTFTGPTGTVTLEAGSEQGYNLPVEESSPYVFTLETSAKKKVLTVKTKTPR